MADYYPVLARAVSRLAVNNAQTREELYEHARTVLVAELERNNPERPTQAALRERIEFETTVLRVEAKSQLGYEESPKTFVSNMEAKSLLLRHCRILPLYCVNLRASLGSLASAGPRAMLMWGRGIS